MSEPTMPEQSSDDTDAGWGDHPAEVGDDQRFLDDRPPHHDR